jgi:hypothetical protein
MCWQYFVEFLNQWQTLIGAFAASALGFAAAIWTIQRTLQSENRKSHRELESIKKVLGAEIRQHANQAYEGHRKCRALAEGPGNFSYGQIANAARFPPPIVFTKIADRLGMLGDEAHWIVFFYAQIQVFKDALLDLEKAPIPNSIAPVNANFAADALLDACEAAVHVLPLLRSGSYYISQDNKFSEAISTARQQWHPEKKKNFTTPLS